MNSVKVLQVLDKISYNSGVSAVVMNYCNHISSDNIDIDFLLYEEPEQYWKDLLGKKGIEFYTTGRPSGREMVAYKKRVKQFFQEHGKKYDVIHLHIPNAAFVVLKYAKKYGVPIRIIHSHNARGADGVIKKIRNYVLNKWGIIYANQYFACGIEAAKYLFGKKKVELNQIVIINNAIDLERYRFDIEARKRIRAELGIDQEVLLGHVGRFEEQKNHKGLLKNFKELTLRDEKYKLVLIGDGPLREALQNEVMQCDLKDKVIFTGIVNNVNEYLSAMDVFLLPSLYEGLPVVCVEAQVAGLPCIISKSVTTEICFTDLVKFVQNEDVDTWCDEINEFSRENGDRKSVDIPKYDIYKQAKRLEGIYMSYGSSADTNVHI